MASYKSSGGVTVEEADGSPSVNASVIKVANGTATDNGDGSVTVATGTPVTDHGALTGLSDDDHAQYALLAGRAGGQTQVGGTAASETLTLQSTAHATKGKVLLGTSAYDEVNNRLGIGTASPSLELEVSKAAASVNAKVATTTATGFATHAINAANTATGGSAVNGAQVLAMGPSFAGGTTNLVANSGMIRGLAAAGLTLSAQDTGAAAILRFCTNGTTLSTSLRLTIDNDGNIALGNAALATSATNGFLFLGTCAGTPTGVPAGSYTGRVPLVFDSTNSILYAYTGGAWVRAAGAHAATHQNGGADEIATTTPASGAIPKAGAGGNIAVGFLATGTPDGTKFVRDDGTLAVPAGTGAPTDATYVTLTTNATLSNERTLAVDTSLSKTDGGAGSTITLSRAALTGDVAASAGSNATTIGANKVTDAMLRTSGALAVVGRSANSTGNVADIQATAASDGVLRESGSVVGFGTIATAGIADAAVTVGKLANLAGLSLLGRSANSSGVTAAITGTDGQVARVSGTTLGFGTVATAGIAANAADDTIIRDGGALSVIGRSANSSGNPADISASAASGAVLRESGSTLGFGTIATAGIADNAVTVGKLAQLAGISVLGRSANTTGDVAAITAVTSGHILTYNGTSVAFAAPAAASIGGLNTGIDVTDTLTLGSTKGKVTIHVLATQTTNVVNYITTTGWSTGDLFVVHNMSGSMTFNNNTGSVPGSAAAIICPSGANTTVSNNFARWFYYTGTVFRMLAQ